MCRASLAQKALEENGRVVLVRRWRGGGVPDDATVLLGYHKMALADPWPYLRGPLRCQWTTAPRHCCPRWSRNRHVALPTSCFRTEPRPLYQPASTMCPPSKIIILVGGKSACWMGEVLTFCPSTLEDEEPLAFLHRPLRLGARKGVRCHKSTCVVESSDKQVLKALTADGNITQPRLSLEYSGDKNFPCTSLREGGAAIPSRPSKNVAAIRGHPSDRAWRQYHQTYGHFGLALCRKTLR